MSANLNIKDGRVSFGFRGAAAWHGTGNEISETDGRAEIARKGGFDFEILESGAGYRDAAGNFRALPGKKMLFRSDSGTPIAVVGDGFKVHQPGEILDTFMDYARTFGFRLHTLGVIGNGERYWAMADTGIDGNANGDDVHKLRAFLGSACDGSMATIADPMAQRVVCGNTFRFAQAAFYAANTKGRKRGGRQYHRSEYSKEQALKDLGFDLSKHAETFESHLETLRALNTVKVDDETAAEWFRALLRPKAEREEVAAATARGDYQASSLADLLAAPLKAAPATAKIEREVRGLESILESYNEAPGAKPGTARGLWEAVTHYVDHSRGTDAGRFKSAQFGQGIELKSRAWEAVAGLVAE